MDKVEKLRKREGNRLIYQSSGMKFVLNKRFNPQAEGREWKESEQSFEELAKKDGEKSR